MGTVEPYPLSYQERAALRRRVGQSVGLLALLQDWRAEVQQPHQCGCMLFVPAGRGYRCLHCMPPLDLPASLRKLIDATLPSDRPRDNA